MTWKEKIVADSSDQHVLDYHITERIGDGYSGVVFRATGKDGPVAIKVYNPALFEGPAAESNLKRFNQQRNLLSHDCPYLVKLPPYPSHGPISSMIGPSATCTVSRSVGTSERGDLCFDPKIDRPPGGRSVGAGAVIGVVVASWSIRSPTRQNPTVVQDQGTLFVLPRGTPSEVG